MPYIAKGKYTEQKGVIGNGQCVTLVKALTGAPPSSLWQERARMVDMLEANMIISPGSAIATFLDGRYPNLPHGNHAAIFLRFVGNGMEVYHQYYSRKPHKTVLSFGRPPSAGVMRAELYSLVR